MGGRTELFENRISATERITHDGNSINRDKIVSSTHASVKPLASSDLGRSNAASFRGYVIRRFERRKISNMLNPNPDISERNKNLESEILRLNMQLEEMSITVQNKDRYINQLESMLKTLLNKYDSIRKKLHLPERKVKEVKKVSEIVKENKTLTEVNEIITAEKQVLLNITTTDSLTKVNNRRGFDSEYEKILGAASRYKSVMSLSCLMLDIDHFKRVNDTYGHETGDIVLQVVAKALLEGRRPLDIVSRYGGEEFVIMLPYTSIEDAVKVANKIREDISKLEFVSKDDKFSITASIGIQSLNFIEGEPNKDKKTLISESDIALYNAKYSGRNRVIVYNESMTMPSKSNK